MGVYDYLEHNKYSNEIVYRSADNFNSYTYKELYRKVNELIDIFTVANFAGKTGIIKSSNSFETVALLIALLESGARPILVDDEFDTFNNNFDFVVYGDINKENKKHSMRLPLYDKKIDDDNNLVVESRRFIDVENKDIYEDNYFSYVKHNTYLKKTDTFFLNKEIGLFTSGSIKNPNLLFFKEEDLIDTFLQKYPKNNERQRIFIPTRISSISGLTINVLEALINHNIVILKQENLADEKSFYDILSQYQINYTFLTRNLIEKFPVTASGNSFDNLNKVLLSGELINESLINVLKSKFVDLPKDSIHIVYGSTEAMGIISSCNDIDGNIMYVDVTKLLNNRFVFTLDKRNVYEKIYNKYIKLDEEFDKYKFVDFLPCSSNLDNIEIAYDEYKNNFGSNIGEVLYTNSDSLIRSGDLGFSFNNRLYLVDRKSNIVTIDDKKYLLSLFEKQIKTLINNTVVAIEKNNIFYIYIGVDNNSLNDNVESLEKKMEVINSIYMETFSNLNIELYLINENVFPLSKSSKKILRNRMYENICQNEDSFYQSKIISRKDLKEKNYDFNDVVCEFLKVPNYKIVNGKMRKNRNKKFHYIVKDNYVMLYKVKNIYKLAKKLILFEYISNIKVDEKKKVIYFKINKNLLVDKNNVRLFYDDRFNKKNRFREYNKNVVTPIKKESFKDEEERNLTDKEQFENYRNYRQNNRNESVYLNKVYLKCLKDGILKYQLVAIEPSQKYICPENGDFHIGNSYIYIGYEFNIDSNLSKSQILDLCKSEYEKYKGTFLPDHFSTSNIKYINHICCVEHDNKDDIMKKINFYDDIENESAVVEKFLSMRSKPLLLYGSNRGVYEQLGDYIFKDEFNLYNDRIPFLNVKNKDDYDKLIKNLILFGDNALVMTVLLCDEFLIDSSNNYDKSDSVEAQRNLINFIKYLYNGESKYIYSLEHENILKVDTGVVKLLFSFIDENNADRSIEELKTKCLLPDLVELIDFLPIKDKYNLKGNVYVKNRK